MQVGVAQSPVCEPDREAVGGGFVSHLTAEGGEVTKKAAVEAENPIKLK